MTWESTEAGNGHQPAVNAIQLVKVVDIAKPLALSVPVVTSTGVAVSWTGGTGRSSCRASSA